MTTETIRPAVPFTAETLERALDDAAGRIVADEVRYCVSALVYGLMRSTSGMTSEQMETLGIDYDDMTRLAYREPDAVDYRDSDELMVRVGGKRVAAYDIESGDDGFRWTELEPIILEDEPAEKGDWFETESEAWADLFETQNLDVPNGGEVYEHWLVTSWLADKLRAKGETVVDDVAGLTIWGRATTGQMIRMDSVIREIARDLHDLPRTAA